MSLSNMTGVTVADARKIQCRTCKHVEKGGIIKGFCEIYEVKPLDVLFRGADCPGYEPGEDMLKYQAVQQVDV